MTRHTRFRCSPTAAALATVGILSLLPIALPGTAQASDHAPAAAPAAAPAPTKAARAEADHAKGGAHAAAANSAGAATATASATATPTAAAAPGPAADPLDQLRQRLSERLATGGKGKAAETAAPYDVRVVAKATPSSAAPGRSTARAAATAAAALSAKAAAADSHGAAWAYNGSIGPASWAAMKPEFSLCGSGQRQSPIDIRGGLSVDLDPVRFDYKASPFGVIDNGHTVQVNMGTGNSIEIGGKRFDLLQFHFHRPSEERIDGRQFEMSVHLVHKDDQGRLAVVALLLDKAPAQSAQPVVQRVWNNLPLERGEEAAARAPLDLAELLPNDRRYYTYMGSLTTPPCSEGVQWIVMKQPVTVTPEQIEIFARMYPMNARPTQQVAGRRILQSN